MTSGQHFVVVGGGLAGAKTAQALRDNDFAGEITVIGAEEHLPYERPPLSKEHLAGKKTFADFVVAPGSWYRDHNVNLMLGTDVVTIDRAAKTIELPDGSTKPYDKLALATGSSPRRLPVPGADAAGVHTLRTIEDSDTLIQLFQSTSRLAIVGAGWIGLEVAAAATQAGIAVTLIESGTTPLLGALGREMGTLFADLHRSHGVDLRLDTEVEQIATEDGKATGVVLADGNVVDTDAVLVAVGARPNTILAEEAGLAVVSGVLVDGGLTTSDPDIVAVGDIAEQEHPLLEHRIRVEHWANALEQPAVAATTMLGGTNVYDSLPYFFTDQYDLGMEYTGYVGPGDSERVVVRGDPDSLRFLAFWLDANNRILAGMNVNIWDVGDRIKELIRSGEPVDPDRLADTSIPL